MRATIISLFAIIFLISIAPVAHAGDVISGVSTGNTTDKTLMNPLGSGKCDPADKCLMDLLNKILDFVIKIGAIVVIVMMVYVGFLFVTARGEPGEISKARTAFLWTVVGALVLLGSQAISVGITETIKALSSGK